MIAKDIFPVYAQHNEDIILAALLHKTKKGFYIDVGANHETYHSVTKYFYDLGWQGINIEPIEKLIKPFTKKRPRDINLPIAIADKKGTLTLREYPEHDGYSTLSEESMHEKDKENLPHRDYQVSVETLASVCKKYDVKNIDFLKVDVEGFEYHVLKGNDWKKYRPKVICIEANHRKSDWSEYITNQKYTRVIFDGLNEYYIADEHLELIEGFAERSALLLHSAIRDHHLNVWQKDIEDINNLRAFTEKQDAHIKSQEERIRILELENQSVKKLAKRIINEGWKKLKR